MNTFQFPIRKADGSQYQDAEQLHQLLEGETSGFYLLSKSGYWHGGIHISNESAPHCVYDQPVRCIADGEVVAYRLNKDYLTSQLGPDTAPLQYSNSFCLVRHAYESPANPEEGPNLGKQNKLTFYSLYMHLLPFDRYPNDDPAYDNRVEVVFSGRAARDIPKSEPGSKKVGVILADTQFDILEERGKDAEGYRFLKGSVVKTRPGDLRKGQEVWFASHKDGQPIKSDFGTELVRKVHPPERVRPAYWRGTVTAWVKAYDGLSMYQPPSGSNFGALYRPNDNLPYNYTFSFDNEKTRPFTQDGITRPVAPCTSGVTTIRGEPIRQTFWAFVDDQTLMKPRVEPARLDTVIVPPTPIPIKAGDPVGYLGLYELPQGTGKKTKHQVHLEVFTSDPKLDAFLNNEAGLKQGKQYLHVPKLEPTIVGQDTQSVVRSYLFQDHVFDLKKLPIERDENGVECYKISAQEKGPAQGAPIRHLKALISKQSPADENTNVRIVSQHDLKAIGFKVVQQHQRDSCSPLNDEKVCQFYAQLSALADVNHDGKITADELRETLKNPEFRERWSKLIVLHHTEWQRKSDSVKWQPMRDRLSASPDRWRHQSQRIDNLVFWDEVAQKVGLPADGRVSYFHPVEFLGSLQVGKLHPTVVIGGQKTELPFLEFYDESVIDEADYSAAAAMLGCEVEAIKAVAITETGSSGSYFVNSGDDKVPTILFERHYFHRLTGGQFDATHADISQRSAGGYGRFSAQYEKMVRAYSLNSNAALRSASWGRFQIMGDNHLRAGYLTVEEFVNDMSLSEKKHLEAFVSFIKSDPVLADSIVSKDWLRFARKYNGAKQVGYDGRMSDNYDVIKNAQ